MAITNSHPSRRSFLKSAGPAIAGGLAAFQLEPEVLAAQMAGSTEQGRIWSNEYWAQKGSSRLYMFRKRMGAPRVGQPSLPVLFLAHGSSTSSRSTYDLTVKGRNDYNVMDKFAGFGFDVWTMDFEGYGRSSKAAGKATVADGVEDLKAAVPVIAKETGQQRYHLYGQSSGGLRVGAYAMAQPERVDRLVLAAFTYTGAGSPTLTDRAKQAEFFRANNTRPRDRAMIRSIFTRDKVGTSDPAVGDAMADAELPLGDTVPTGTYLDMTTNLPVVDPLKVLCPVLMVRGEYDGIATNEDLLNFFTKLPNGDKQYIILPGTAHSVSMGLNRDLFAHVVRAFLEMPKRVDNLNA